MLKEQLQQRLKEYRELLWRVAEFGFDDELVADMYVSGVDKDILTAKDADGNTICTIPLVYFLSDTDKMEKAIKEFKLYQEEQWILEEKAREDRRLAQIVIKKDKKMKEIAVFQDKIKLIENEITLLV